MAPFSNAYPDSDLLTIGEVNDAEVLLLRWHGERAHQWLDDQRELATMEMD